MSLVKSNKPDFITLNEMANRVTDGACISIGGHHFARLPIQLLRAICHNKPKKLKYLSWAGGLPLEMLLSVDAVETIDICFSSLDIFGLAPRFRKAVETAHVTMRDWPALALIQSFRAREQNMPFLPMQIPEGSSMMEICPALSKFKDPITGREMAMVEAREIGIFATHAPRADTAGNVEIYGAQALDKVQAGAAKQVLITVDEIVPEGTLQANGRNLILPRNRISAIAHVNGGAYPCSSLPHYVTDWAYIRKVIESDSDKMLDALALPESGVPEHLQKAAKLPLSKIKPQAFQPSSVPLSEPATLDEIMAVAIARDMDNESYASAGAVSPLGNVAYRLAKSTHAPDMMITTLSGGHVDVDAGTLSLSLLESMDAQSALTHTGGEDTYWDAYQGSYVTHEIVGTAQIDAKGRTNTLSITKPNGGMLRLPGQGGMADVANMHRDFVVYVTRHSPATLVESVEVVSAGRGVLTRADREGAGYRPGFVRLFTNLCSFCYDEHEGQLVVDGIMPNVSHQDIIDQTGFKVIFSKTCETISLPTDEELFALRYHVDPIGLRRLEFVGAKDRSEILNDLLARDRVALDRMCGV